MESAFQKILSTHFGIDNEESRRLPGYSNVNYKVKIGGRSYVAKFYQDEPGIRSQLLAESRLLEQLNVQTEGRYPSPVKSKDGELVVLFGAQESPMLCRILSFLPGQVYADVPHSIELIRSLGSFLGEHMQLMGQMEEIRYRYRNPWDLAQFELNRDKIEHISDPHDQSLIRSFFVRYSENVSPQAGRLRSGPIHADANDYNILVVENKVAGLIDFGDMCHSWLINEVAIALTYALFYKDDPLEVAREIMIGFCENFPLERIECEVLYDLIAARLCTSLCNSAEAESKGTSSEYINISASGAWALLKKWVRINPLLATHTFLEAAGHSTGDIPRLEKLLDQRKKYFSTSLSVTYTSPLHLHSGSFQYLYDWNGNTILDAYNNIILVGHCHPVVVEAGQRALAKLNTNTRYIYDELTRYADKLLAHFPEPLSKVFFVNSGSAASDLALRMARTFTGVQHTVVMEHGYHGNTIGTIQVSNYKYSGKGGFDKPEWIFEAELPDMYRGAIRDNDDAISMYVKDLEDKLKSVDKVGAFIAEPIVGCGGQVPLPKGYLSAVYALIRSKSGLCISDEVQVGFGRLGTSFWGFEQHGVVPDIVVLGKPIGNGHPIGAVVCTDEVAERFDNGMEFFSSFGGNPVSCSIGMAVLDVLASDDLQNHAKITGQYLINGLNDLSQTYESIGDVRGSGLFLGVEIVKDRESKSHATQLASIIKNELRNNHVLVSTDGPYDNVLKIKPPLYFNQSNADELIERLSEVMRGYRP